MRKSILTPLALAVTIVVLALMRTATASHTLDHKAFSGGSTFKGLVVKTERTGLDVTAVSPNWTTVDSRGFEIPAGESQLVVVDFFSETNCLGTADHCSARVLIGRTLSGAVALEPADGTNFAIDDAPSDDNPEGHAMSRALCVRNATGSPVNVSVWLQATRAGGGVSTFHIDDWTFKIARNAPCSPAVNI